jgi:phosphatidylglycerol:prolipoprotein diacylglycerol transferase
MMQQLMPLNPIALHLGWFSIHWYGIILAVATAVGLWVALREGRRLHLSTERLMDMMFIAVPVSIICARIYYVAFRWEYYRAHVAEIFAIWHGGIAIYGAIFGAMLTIWFFVRRHKMSFVTVADVVAPGFLLAQAIGRWGNFMNQEAYGAIIWRTDLEALRIPAWIVDQMWIDGAYRQPTFLYESLWCVAGLIVLLFVRRMPWTKRGDIALFYVLWYAVGRFFIEGLRTDSLLITAPSWGAQFLYALWSPMASFVGQGMLNEGVVRVSQLVSLLLVLIVLCVGVWRLSHHKKIPPYKGAIRSGIQGEKKNV